MDSILIVLLVIPIVLIVWGWILGRFSADEWQDIRHRMGIKDK